MKNLKSKYPQCPPKEHNMLGDILFGYPKSTQRNKCEEPRGPLLPPLHSAHRGSVTSSTTPQQRQLQQTHPNMNQYHSSPSALPAYGVMFSPRSQQVSQDDRRQPVPYQYQPNYQPTPFPQQILYPMQMPHPSMMILPGPQVPTSQSFNQQQSHRMGHSQDSSGHPHSMRLPASSNRPAYNPQNRQVFSSPNPQAQHHAMSVCMNPQQMLSGPQQARIHHPQQSFKMESDSRYNLYKNLCALFTHATVERVLTLYPDETNPTRLAKLCLEF